jgi:hypothetical protein
MLHRSDIRSLARGAGSSEISGEGQRFSHRSVFFTVDTCVSRCYKPLKDKLFGGESPNELQNAVRE